MAKKIDTNLGIDVSLTSPSPVTGISVSLPSEPKGKSEFQSLADVFKNLQPAVNNFVTNAAEKNAKEDKITGANIINGMTREEAMAAHEAGFPDVKNGWVRHGMYDAIAKNSATTFHLNFLENYTRDRVDPNYNWEKDYAERTKLYLQGKENDPFWNKHFATASEQTRKTIFGMEYEHQSDKIKSTITSYTVQAIRLIPDKIDAALQAAWYESNPITANDHTYNERKTKFYRDNVEKFFLNAVEDIKINRNVGIDKKDFDALVLSGAEAHLDEGGRYAAFFGKYITSNRPDGTPSIADKPELRPQMERVLTKIKKIQSAAEFGENFKSFKTAGYDNSEYNKQVDEYFNGLISQAKSTGYTDHDAILAVIASHKPYIAGNRPIAFIQELVNRPVGQGGDTADNKLTLAVVKELKDSGALATYFGSDTKNALKWSMAVNLMQSGEPTSKIFLTLANIEKNQTFIPLTEVEKRKLQDIAGTGLAANQDLVYTVAQFYKNAGVTDFNKQTIDFLEKNYFKDGVDRWVANSKVIDLGIAKNEYGMYADTAYKILSEKIDGDVFTPSISDTEASTTGGIPALANKKNYNFVINSENNYAYFTIVNQLGTDIPLTVKKYILDDSGMKIPAVDEKGNKIVGQDFKHQEIILKIPLKVLKERVASDLKNASMQIELENQKRDTVLRLKNEAIDNYIKNMGGGINIEQQFKSLTNPKK
jgi:hypothetical protein